MNYTGTQPKQPNKVGSAELCSVRSVDSYAVIESKSESSEVSFLSEARAKKLTERANLLTNYKKDVDISKNYGLTTYDLQAVKEKIRLQNNFLEFSYVENNMTGQKISLKDCVISSNHNPDRYYGEIQNRINTLEREALEAKLVPVFLTLTLPSEFHSMKHTRSGKLINNPKYNGIEPKEAVKVLTKMWGKLRHDRSLKELTKHERMYYRVNEPHKDGTPHTHILLFIPKDRIERIDTAFKRLFNPKSNKFEKDIRSASSYIMKYINKTLPMSKKQITKQDEYLNAWYIKNRVNRFCSSRSTAPMYLYRMLHHRFTLYALTQIRKSKTLKVLARMEDDKIMEIWDGEELLFMRNENISVHTIGGLAA